jgi:hypothetical protein
MLLLKNLAGYGAEMLLDKSQEWENIFEYYEDNYCDTDFQFETEGTDFNRAIRIAQIMAKPFMPWGRILTLADKWTLEMLRIPTIWKIVETVADNLIRRGEIRGNACQKLSDMACDSSFSTVFRLPKWKRRLLPKPGELDKYIERA